MKMLAYSKKDQREDAVERVSDVAEDALQDLADDRDGLEDLKRELQSQIAAVNEALGEVEELEREEPADGVAELSL